MAVPPINTPRSFWQAFWQALDERLGISALKYLRVLLDPNPWGVKKEGVPCSKIVSTPFTILTRKPFWWLPTFG
ncbi:hypothetical protein, partial [Thermus scotoductus]|uniref:hypothetical protein n=1 Tax=Thermus scotoductus TaxID=37636 RepID=UPI001C12CB81